MPITTERRIADALAFNPIPDFGVAYWADTYRRLSTMSAAIPGPWRTERVEVMRGPMNAVTEKGVRQVTIETATQIGKSSVLENVIGYMAHFRPGPMLLVLPKEASARRFSKERISPLIRATPALLDVFGSDEADKSGVSFQYRPFTGGFLAIEGATPTNLAERPIKILMCDEIDKYENTKEGDPVNLAIERTARFSDSKVILTCSPTLEEDSKIDDAYKASDQRRAFVACPHCGHEQILNFFNSEAGAVVNWDKGEDGEHRPETAAIYCEQCGKPWTEQQRLSILTTKGAVMWRQTRTFTCCGEEQDPMQLRNLEHDEQAEVWYATCKHCGERGVSNHHAGFHVSKLYDPQIRISALAEKWIDSKDTIEQRQVFLNTNLAKAFSTEASSAVNPTGLAARREIYPAEVPDGVLVISIGVDAQTGGSVNEGFMTASVWGWGFGEESWLLAHEVIPGDPFQPALWRQLEALLVKPWKRTNGGVLYPVAVAIDSGGDNPEPVYTFCAARRTRNVWAVKGASDRGGQWAPIWPDARNIKIKRTKDTRFRPTIVGANKGKDFARQQLLVDTPGPSYVHFPEGIPQGYFDQLTSEKLRFKPHKHYHLPRGLANEALDCRVYAYAALQGWKARGGKFEHVQQKRLLDDAKPSTDSSPAPAARSRPSKWMSGVR